jgi:biopolymer transport protein ExbB/TolQ
VSDGLSVGAVTSSVAVLGLVATWVTILIRYRSSAVEGEGIAGGNYARVIEGMRILMDQQRSRLDELEAREQSRRSELDSLRREVARLVVQEGELRREIDRLRRQRRDD